MKQRFSTHWIGSKQPRKQRKYRYNLPLHLRHKLMSANLTKDLRKKYGRRNVPVRKNDVVKVMRGKFKKKTGKVSIVNLKKLKVAIESLQVQKKDGTKVNVYFDPSNIQITELNLDDKERTKSLERKNAH
jgi:large subunit ribosomal protein L24